MKKFLSLVLSFCILALLLPALPVSAVTEGPYTEGSYSYTVTGNEATITSFSSKPYLGALAIPNSLGGYPVTAIGDNAFYGCYRITSLTFPSALRTIGNYAFSYCTALSSITIPEGVTHIGTSAFSGCELVTSIVLPDSVTYMGTGAFSWCGKATSINIPAGITSLPERVFYHMPSLQSIIIPKAITAIGANLFSVAPKDIYYTGTEAEWNAISIEFPNYALEEATIHYTDDTDLIPTAAPTFIPTAAPTEGPFYWKADFRETNSTPNGSTISYREDTGLSMICRDNGCSPFSAQWSATPFINAYHPTSYTLNFTARQTGGVKGNPWEGFSIVVYYPNGTGSTTLIHFVPNISGGVDLYVNGTMGPNVASVDTSYHSYSISFNEKEGKITSLKIDGTEKLTAPISWTAPSLYESVGINYSYGLTSFDSTPCEFYITELSIGTDGYVPPSEAPTETPTERPTTSPESLFAYRITDNGTATITGFASQFTGGEVVIPSTLGGYPVTFINNYAFEDIRSITSLVVPEGVKTIGYAAFAGCNNLKTVTLPVSLKTIDAYAFGDCTFILDVYYPGAYANWYYISFGEGNTDLTRSNIHYSFSPSAIGTYIDSTFTVTPLNVTAGSRISYAAYKGNQMTSFDTFLCDGTTKSFPITAEFDYIKIFLWDGMQPIVNPVFVTK